ncbi:alcohol dehydrogenase catalytic domain-containing protein, partial [Kitasatospora sp. NPDC058263]
MRAVVVHQPGGPEALTPVDLPDPVPGPGEVLVRTGAIGVNFKDVYEREGRTGATAPFTPGCEGAGTVVA